jgi:uncharacterized protein YodC (DUF2158 family)
MSMRTKSPKPKFNLGQIVHVDGDGRLIKISSRNYQPMVVGIGRWYYWEENKSVGFAEKELRPQTNREVGRTQS